MSPGSPQEFKALFIQTYDKNKINYFKLTENPHGYLFDEPIIFGQAIKIKNGKDLTIVSVGPQLANAISASKALEEDGYEVDLIYYHTLKPFDEITLRESLLKTRKLITIEELSAHDGVFNLCLKVAVDVDKVKVKQLAIDGFVHGYGSYSDLCHKTGLSASNLYNNSKKLILNK